MTLSTNSLLAQARDCLSELIDSAFLDASEMASDCLEVFDTYEWEPMNGLSEKDAARWSELRQKGNDNELSSEELSEFLSLTNPEGQTHSYYYRIQARKLLESIQKHENKAIQTAESIDKASKEASAICMFDLASGDRNIDVANALSPDAIFDAVQLSSSLTINVDDKAYQLEPYWNIDQHIALEMLEDVRTTVENALIAQYNELTTNGLT